MTVITISRGTFSGGEQLAECVSKKLSLRCISREVVAQAASRYGIEERKLFKALMEKPGLLDRMNVERIHYLVCIRAALINEAKDDDVVYHGNAGHFLLRDLPHAIKVRVIANMEFRIKSAMERNGLNREEAMKYIEKVDHERESWTRFLYHVDWRDPILYDIVINLDKISMDSACELVCKATTLDEFKTPSNWKKVSANLALSSEVRARVAMNDQIGKLDQAIKLSAEDGVITIKGSVDYFQDAVKIEQIIRKMPNIKDVVIKTDIAKKEIEIY